MVFSFTNGAWIQTKYGGKECFPFTNRAWVQINYKGKGVVKIKYKKTSDEITRRMPDRKIAYIKTRNCI